MSKNAWLRNNYVIDAYFSERIDYERSIENQMEMINQQNHEIESLRGMKSLTWPKFDLFWPKKSKFDLSIYFSEDLRSKDENISRLRHVNVELIERLRTTQQSAENVLNVGDRRDPR